LREKLRARHALPKPTRRALSLNQSGEPEIPTHYDAAPRNCGNKNLRTGAAATEVGTRNSRARGAAHVAFDWMEGLAAKRGEDWDCLRSVTHCCPGDRPETTADGCAGPCMAASQTTHGGAGSRTQYTATDRPLAGTVGVAGSQA
jgi:hypothetical protein